jgi:hypothetical protein
MADTAFDPRFGFLDLPATLAEVTSKREMKRFLQEHGWSRHQRGYVRRQPAPDGDFHSLEDAYTIAMGSVSEPIPQRPDGRAATSTKP